MSAGWALLGGLGWSVSEYVIHRFVGHGKPRLAPEKLIQRLSPQGFVGAFNAEHRAHHTDTTYFAPSSQKVVAACVAIPAVAALLTPFVGLRRATSFAVGFSAAYGGYEFAHRRIHTHPPINAYGRWMRRHHLDHHHRTPRANHGVTSNVWDHVFRTELPSERVRVPRSAAPAWMVDPTTNQVRPEYAADYELAGTATKTAGARPSAS